MATALAVYVTNSTLAANTAESYGFLVTEYGLGGANYEISSEYYAAFGLENSTEPVTVMTILQILQATDSQTVDGNLYDLDALLRSLANEVYSSINESGDI